MDLIGSALRRSVADSVGGNHTLPGCDILSRFDRLSIGRGDVMSRISVSARVAEENVSSHRRQNSDRESHAFLEPVLFRQPLGRSIS